MRNQASASPHNPRRGALALIGARVLSQMLLFRRFIRLCNEYGCSTALTAALRLATGARPLSTGVRIAGSTRPNGAQLNRGRGRVGVEPGPSPAPWRFAPFSCPSTDRAPRHHRGLGRAFTAPGAVPDRSPSSASAGVPLGHPDASQSSRRHSRDEHPDGAFLCPLISLAAVVVAGQVVAVVVVAAVAVALAGVTVLTAAALLVPAASRLPRDHRDRDRRRESWGNACSGPFATEPLQAVSVRRALVVLEAGSVGLVVAALVPGRAGLTESTKAQEGQCAAHGGRNHRAAGALLCHLPRQRIKPIVVQDHFLPLHTVHTVSTFRSIVCSTSFRPFAAGR